MASSARRLWKRLSELYRSSRDVVRLSSEVIEEHKSLLWLLGTGSSALAGWAVYTMRRLHYSRIEEEIYGISSKMEGLERRQEERARLEISSEVLAPSPWQTKLVVAPAVASAFLLGYAAGRTSSSFMWRRQLRVSQELRSGRRVYVAVVPEEHFDARFVCRELEKVIANEAKPKGEKSSWFLWKENAKGKDDEKAKDVKAPAEIAP